MGGDKVVAALAGNEVEEERGGDIRAAEKPLCFSIRGLSEQLEGPRWRGA